MPRYILKLHDDQFNKDYYMEWSTIVDAPVTYGISLEEFNKYYLEEYGKAGMEELPERMNRVEETGISCFKGVDDFDSIMSFNRAGKNGKSLNKEQILQQFCRNKTT